MTAESCKNNESFSSDQTQIYTGYMDKTMSTWHIMANTEGHCGRPTRP